MRLSVRLRESREAMSRVRHWSQLYEGVESRVADAFGVLGDAVAMLTHRSVLERMQQQGRAVLGRMAKQVEEVSQPPSTEQP